MLVTLLTFIIFFFLLNEMRHFTLFIFPQNKWRKITLVDVTFYETETVQWGSEAENSDNEN